MSWSTPLVPNVADYTLFLVNTVGIDPLYLPPNSPFIGYAFGRAINITNVPPVMLSSIEYTLAVYNCATHIQLKITPDQIVNTVSYTYFLSKRAEFQLLLPITGVVAASSDQGSSVTNAVPESLKNITMSDLDFMKTPWGRDFLAYQQDYGPTVWGLS